MVGGGDGVMGGGMGVGGCTVGGGGGAGRTFGTAN